MRISIILPRMSMGAMTSANSTLARGLDKLGADVEVVVFRASEEELNEHAVVRARLLARNRRGMFSVPAIVRYIRDRRPDVVFAVASANVPAVIATKLAGTQTRVVISERGNLSLDTLREHRWSPKMRLYPWLMKFVYPHADGIITASPGPLADPMFRDFVNISHLPQAVIPNALTYRARVENPIEWENVDSLWKRTEREYPLAIAVGRLAEQKGFDVLIRSIGILRDRNFPVRLLILGEGEKRATLDQLINGLNLSELVRMPGKVLNPLWYMKQSDIFVLSSNWEAFGNVLIEAMHSGIPIVSTRAPVGPETILVDGKTALLVPVGDMSVLADSIQRVLSDGNLAERIRQNAEAESKNYSAESVAKKYLEFFARILAKE